MDAAKKKALFRAKLNAQKKDKRIDSPLVRYNEFDQPVCRVCDVVLKSESLWDAHQASRKHHQAVNNIKANAVGRVHTKPESHAESTRPKQAPNADLHETKFEPSAKLPKPQSSSVLPADCFDNHETQSTTPKRAPKAELPHKKFEPLKPSELQSSSALPPDFFDNRVTKRQKSDAVKSLDPDSCKTSGSSFQNKVELSVETDMNGLISGNDVQSKISRHAREFKHTTTENSVSETKQVKGALPEGFFDDKEADLLARGIKVIKPDVKDEYKEFEKLIQEDLQEVDDRLEEEEIDAAEMIEEAESVEQKAYRGKVELLRMKKMELMTARSAKQRRDSAVAGKESSHEESSSDDDDNDENFAVDWRAQHL